MCGIIHTDLKPENVLVGCPRGVPVNKTGVPLVGNVDPAAVANLRKDTAAKAEDVKKNKKKDRDQLMISCSLYYFVSLKPFGSF